VFCEGFRAVYAPKLLETLLKLLSGIANGEFLPGRVVSVALNFLGHAYVGTALLSFVLQRW